MNPIVLNKFNGKATNYSIQEDNNMFNICIYGTNNRVLYYQTYKIVSEYCGNIYFDSIQNEFNDGMLFTTKELKILFDIDSEYPDVNNYHIDSLFNSTV